MSCHLHDVVDDLLSVRVRVNSDLSAPYLMTVLDDIAAVLPGAICFDIGDVSEFEGLTQIPGMLRLPYPVCWFECVVTSPAKCLAGALAWERKTGGIELALFGRDPSTHSPWKFVGTAEGVREWLSPEGAAVRAACYPSPDHLFPVINLLWSFLSALNCVNVSRVENKPDAKLQRARARRGKRPIFSYWTLNVDLDRGRSQSTTGRGVHASPRVHLRRGHARQFSPGRWTWINPAVIGQGKASGGIVHKDYAVKQRPFVASLDPLSSMVQ